MIDFVEVFLVRTHEHYEGDIIRFILEDNQWLEVTPSHCMLIASGNSMSQTVKLADQVKEGDKFLNSGGQCKEIAKVEVLDNQMTDVYDIVTPTFTVFANDMLVCSYGEDTATMAPKAFLENGMAIYQQLGALKCK